MLDHSNQLIWYTFRHVREQCVPATIHEQVRQIYAEHGSTIGTSTETKEYSIDMPGMISMGRKWHYFYVDGLKLSIPIEDIRSFYEYLASSVPFKNKNGEFAGPIQCYKVSGFMQSLWLDRYTRGILISKLQIVGLERKAEIDAEAEEFSQKLAKINKDKVVILSRKDKNLKATAKRLAGNSKVKSNEH